MKRGGFPSLNGAYPIVGHLPEMYRAFPSMCARGASTHGSLFWIEGGPGARQLMCVDPEALEALRDPAASTSFYAEGFDALLSGTLFCFDGAEHKRIRGAMTPAFTPTGLKRTDAMEIVRGVATRTIDGWIDRGRADVVTEAKDMGLEIIFRLIGVPAQDVPAWRRQYARYLLAGLPSRGGIPGPLRWIAGRARSWLDARLGVIVDELRAAHDESSLIGAIANRRDDGGVLLERQLVVANLRLLVLAGHETTAAALSWNMLHLAESRELQAKAVAEVEGEDDLVALVSDRDRFTFAEAQFREATRLYPAVHSIIRRLRSDIELADSTIPSGTLLNVPLSYLLRDPNRFDAPDRYQPERWTERPRPGTVDTAMFGGGPHFCLGYHVAIAEGTLFNLLLAAALRRRGVRMRRLSAAPFPKPIFLPLIHPPRGQTVLFEAHS